MTTDKPETPAPTRTMPVVVDHSNYSGLLDSNRYEHIQRIAMVYSRSKMIPTHFQGKMEDVFVVCQMAFRMGIDPLMLLQNTYVVSGKPGIAGQMAIALANQSGAFNGRIRFRYEGDGQTRSCTAWTHDKQTGEVLECRVGIDTAVAEGWIKNPKWKSMPDQMLAYRSGAWFARLYCPDALFGMQTMDELEDLGMLNITPAGKTEKAAELDKLLAAPAKPNELSLKSADELDEEQMRDEEIAQLKLQAEEQ